MARAIFPPPPSFAIMARAIFPPPSSFAVMARAIFPPPHRNKVDRALQTASRLLWSSSCPKPSNGRPSLPPSLDPSNSSILRPAREVCDIFVRGGPEMSHTSSRPPRCLPSRSRALVGGRALCAPRGRGVKCQTFHADVDHLAPSGAAIPARPGRRFINIARSSEYRPGPPRRRVRATQRYTAASS